MMSEAIKGETREKRRGNQLAKEENWRLRRINEILEEDFNGKVVCSTKINSLIPSFHSFHIILLFVIFFSFVN